MHEHPVKIPFNFGVPHKLKHWALYEPTLDRFLFVSGQQEVRILNEIRMLCSSRYNLFLCDISVADNYCHDLVDNTCCENWSILDGVDNTLLLASPIDVHTLISQSITETQYPIIQQQKNWIQLVSYWVEWINLRCYYKQYETIDYFIEQLFDTKLSKQNSLIQQIQLELYLGVDVDITHANIIRLITAES
jgi:hypothetical protein